MKYDPIELMKLNLTEESIQKQRDLILKGLTEVAEDIKFIIVTIHKVYLPFIIDMLDDNEFSCDPFGAGLVKITVTINHPH